MPYRQWYRFPKFQPPWEQYDTFDQRPIVVPKYIRCRFTFQSYYESWFTPLNMSGWSPEHATQPLREALDMPIFPKSFFTRLDDMQFWLQAYYWWENGPGGSQQPGCSWRYGAGELWHSYTYDPVWIGRNDNLGINYYLEEVVIYLSGGMYSDCGEGRACNLFFMPYPPGSPPEPDASNAAQALAVLPTVRLLISARDSAGRVFWDCNNHPDIYPPGSDWGIHTFTVNWDHGCPYEGMYGPFQSRNPHPTNDGIETWFTDDAGIWDDPATYRAWHPLYTAPCDVLSSNIGTFSRTSQASLMHQNDNPQYGIRLFLE